MKFNEYYLKENFKERIMTINLEHPESWLGITSDNVNNELPDNFSSGKFIHFTNKTPERILETGFKGVRYMNDLMGEPPTKENKIDIGVDVIFAFPLDLSEASFYSALKTYGRNAIIFQSESALEIFSPIDYQFEYLISVNDINNAVPIENISYSQFKQLMMEK